jgi:hypothetical protein
MSSLQTIRNVARRLAGQRLDKYAMAIVANSKTVVHFDRPDWLLKRNAVPVKPSIVFRDPEPVTNREVALCERLLAAYERAATGRLQTEEGMWAQPVFQHRQRALREPLDRRDAALLAERLAGMFRSDFVLGISAPGSLAVGGSGLTRWLVAWHALNKFVALAESQAAAPLENPEQGGAGLAFAGGMSALVEATERALGVSLNFPEVGAAYGLRLDGRLVTPETPDQLYGAARLREAIVDFLGLEREPVRVVEVGGGYGGMAYWFLRMTKDARYAIVDLPIVNVLQGYFLSLALGEDAVSLCGEPERQVSIVPPHELEAISTPCDVLVNKDSLPEIPRGEALAYLAWARQHCTGFFYSYNQEAAAVVDGVAQNVVSELVSDIEGYRRARRDPSWLRAGYVEEIYLSGEA